ncbi:hypothetical protein LRS74_23665 [Streptomyces sp. LX-29]|uniref:hypothetical protein n=1 Tax=Streptomyces sp. LX-29 TaxID=2900152 RepID=UPI00240D5462|nr:hypothetical protein [Streptomyces sp. LX-29]WFB09713.1 hypothetical protein LRS74_23665 [Streptomyces sp. LX-29]
MTHQRLTPADHGRSATDAPGRVLGRTTGVIDEHRDTVAIEDAQVFMCGELLGHARYLLDRPEVDVDELRFLAKRLVEALHMAVNVAESRDQRSMPLTPMPAVGDPVLDAMTGRVGLLIGWAGPQRARVTLRPPDGQGKPWDTATFRQPTAEEWPALEDAGPPGSSAP